MLPAPGLHDQADRQVFDEPYLHADRQTKDGDGLTLSKVLHGTVDDLLRSVVTVEILDGVVMDRRIEELSFDPARCHSHDMDLSAAKFQAKRP